METPPQAGPRASRIALGAALFGVVAILVSQTIWENGTNSWTSLPAWAAFGALAALLTLLPWIPSWTDANRATAWRAAAGGVGALALLWVLFVLPSIYRNVAFLYTMGAAASGWGVWNAPGRPPRRS